MEASLTKTTSSIHFSGPSDSIEAIKTALDSIVFERLNSGIQSSRSSLITELLAERLLGSDYTGTEMPEVVVSKRFEVNIPKQYQWLIPLLEGLVNKKRQAGIATTAQLELVLLAVHGILSDPTYGEYVRSLLNVTGRAD